MPWVGLCAHGISNAMGWAMCPRIIHGGHRVGTYAATGLARYAATGLAICYHRVRFIEHFISLVHSWCGRWRVGLCKCVGSGVMVCRLMGGSE
jgi:hypothetical protein